MCLKFREYAQMSPIFLALLFVMIASEAREYNTTQLNKLSGKVDDEANDVTKSVGFLYELNSVEPFCGAALINVRTAITDGSCVPQRTDLSLIFVEFGLMLSFLDHTLCDILYPKYIQDRWDNVSLALLLLSLEVRMTDHVSSIQPYGVPSIEEGPGYIVGWNTDWEIVVDRIIVPTTETNCPITFLSSPRSYDCTPLKSRGHLVIKGKSLVAISVLTQDATQRIVYLNLGTVHGDITRTLYELLEMQKHIERIRGLHHMHEIQQQHRNEILRQQLLLQNQARDLRQQQKQMQQIHLHLQQQQQQEQQQNQQQHQQQQQQHEKQQQQPIEKLQEMQHSDRGMQLDKQQQQNK